MGTQATPQSFISVHIHPGRRLLAALTLFSRRQRDESRRS